MDNMSQRGGRFTGNSVSLHHQQACGCAERYHDIAGD